MSVLYQQFAPVVFGEGAVNDLPDEIRKLGGSTVLCIYDRGVAECGIGDRIVKIIEDAGIKAYAFGETVVDPPDYQIDNLYNEYKDKGIDLIVGIGGGSCLDTAKGVAFMFTHHPESIRPHVYIGPDSLWGNFPLIEIPTTSGTGSEVSPVAVITDTSCGFKGGVLIPASLTILDPELTKTAPPFITATTGMDAFSHAAEAMTAKSINPMAEVLGTKSIQNVVKYLPTATHEGDNMEARNAMSIASNFAGIAFSDAPVHLGHALAETIGARTHQPHGLCCALCVAPTMEYVGEYCPGRIKPVADAMGVDYADIADDEKAIGLRVGDAIRDLLKVCDIPNFADRGVDREVVMELAHDVATNFHSLESPTEITDEIAAHCLARAYDAY